MVRLTDRPDMTSRQYIIFFTNFKFMITKVSHFGCKLKWPKSFINSFDVLFA